MRIPAGVRAYLCAAFGVPILIAAMARTASAQPMLNAITTQSLPNGRTHVLLQFNTATGIFVRSNTAAPTTNFTLQIPNATAAPTVQTIYQVNQGDVQTITVGQVGASLTIAITLVTPVRPRMSPIASNGLVIIDVPPGAAAAAPNPFAPVARAPAYATPAPPGGGAEITKVIRLRYADVSEVVGVLTASGGVAPSNVFNPQSSQLGTAPVTGFGTIGNAGFPQAGFPQTGQTFPGSYQQPFGATGTETAGMGQRINDNLAIDRRLNAVILTGTPDQVAKAESLIKLVDVPVQSILLDTEVLEVTETGAKALGLDYSQSPTTPITRVFNTQSQAVNQIAPTAVPGSLELQSNIFLLISKGAARVLASPKILTEDGMAASILTGDSLPIRVTTPVGVGGVGAVSSQVEYINVGVNLQILPHVTSDRGVETNVFSQVSSVTGFTTSNDPQISTRQAQTKVNLVEGQTLVIGGLLQQRDIHNMQKIPILGDIPIVGALFRFYTETRQNTNLIITITPHIIAAPQELPPAPAGTPAPAGY